MTTPSAPVPVQPSGDTRRGKGNPSCLRAALQLEMGPHPPSHPAQTKQSRRSGHTVPNQ